MNTGTPEKLSVSDIKMPPALAQRLEEESERFGKNTTPESLSSDMASHASKHESLLIAKSEIGRSQVEHAKLVAEEHHQGTGMGTGTVTANATAELESAVLAKRVAVETKQAELSDLDSKLKAMEAREAELKSMLGA